MAFAETAWKCTLHTQSGAGKDGEYGYAILKLNYWETKAKWFIFGEEREYKITNKDDYYMYWVMGKKPGTVMEVEFSKYTGKMNMLTNSSKQSAFDCTKAE